MLLEVLQEFFIADQRFVDSLIKYGEIPLVFLQSLPDCLIYQMGKRASGVRSLQPQGAM